MNFVTIAFITDAKQPISFAKYNFFFFIILKKKGHCNIKFDNKSLISHAEFFFPLRRHEGQLQSQGDKNVSVTSASTLVFNCKSHFIQLKHTTILL